MRLARLAVIALALTLFASSAFAQTTRSLIWNYTGTNVANVATWTQVVRVNGTVLTAPPVCGNVGANVECSVPLPTLNQTTNNVLSVSASGGGDTYESILNYNPSTAPTNPNGPKQPGGLGIKVVVIVTVGTP